MIFPKAVASFSDYQKILLLPEGAKTDASVKENILAFSYHFHSCDNHHHTRYDFTTKEHQSHYFKNGSIYF
ncbi:MAG: hypothetical protein IPO06_27820 [Leptospiraceae bacterium]|nr:hypothetical protein [Leptospiraceae bacterium]